MMRRGLAARGSRLAAGGSRLAIRVGGGGLTRCGLFCLAVVLGASGCRQDMHDAPRYDPLESSDFFADKRASRDLVEGTVARGQLRADEAYYTGKAGGVAVSALPMPLTRELVTHGQQRFNIYCAPCHGRTGDGNGFVVQRGYRQPTSFHDPRLQSQPVGYFVDVMTNGFGQMPSYAKQVPPADRWAIATYLRALQMSRTASLSDVPAADRSKLEGKGAAPGEAEHGAHD
jgi:mono/diheme cytochrome c family protein